MLRGSHITKIVVYVIVKEKVCFCLRFTPCLPRASSVVQVMLAWSLEVVMEMTSKWIRETRGKTDKTDLMNLTWKQG